MFEREEAFYSVHKTEFLKKYGNKWLVIVGESIWGIFNTLSDAAKCALQNFEPGDFMIHNPSRDGMVIEIGPKIHTRSQDNDTDQVPDCIITATGSELISFPYA